MLIWGIENVSSGQDEIESLASSIKQFAPDLPNSFPKADAVRRSSHFFLSFSYSFLLFPYEDEIPNPRFSLLFLSKPLLFSFVFPTHWLYSLSHRSPSPHSTRNSPRSNKHERSSPSLQTLANWSSLRTSPKLPSLYPELNTSLIAGWRKRRGTMRMQGGSIVWP